VNIRERQVCVEEDGETLHRNVLGLSLDNIRSGM